MFPSVPVIDLVSSCLPSWLCLDPVWFLWVAVLLSSVCLYVCCMFKPPSGSSSIVPCRYACDPHWHRSLIRESAGRLHINWRMNSRHHYALKHQSHSVMPLSGLHHGPNAERKRVFSEWCDLFLQLGCTHRDRAGWCERGREDFCDWNFLRLASKKCVEKCILWFPLKIHNVRGY